MPDAPLRARERAHRHWHGQQKQAEQHHGDEQQKPHVL